MKKTLILFAALTITCTYASADTYTYSVRHAPTSEQSSDTYYLDRRLNEQKQQSDPNSTGLLTRFGYAFNYDALPMVCRFSTNGAGLPVSLQDLTGITFLISLHIVPFRMIQYLPLLSRSRCGTSVPDL